MVIFPRKGFYKELKKCYGINYYYMLWYNIAPIFKLTKQLFKNTTRNIIAIFFFGMVVESSRFGGLTEDRAIRSFNPFN